ncbi:LacI family DNA-binding transcriptional regulator [Tessaracoccus sp. Y36]|uniref:LacI family DNA-binding transcriptional regulator n=1 Tax=Tessaracoccus sp. ZS01 TaxID=1906324 RepID=UPI00096DDFFC|nr:LacI family DNA-binding transcriptional regulator [Tessaracoccus sp. ZS01]MCG6568327.1 LacI family transcriptional regulator [Tessaracoccus sp. ZS01]OMG53296.1 hypothetical protein BJN44_11960 [Tessaracoccus sp. ZS01]
MNKPTLASLAAELNLSRQTVSNVLNFPDRVRPETRARVQEAIERSGYRPSAAARALRNQRAMSLGLRLSNPRNGISGSIMDAFTHSLVERADQSGYRVVLFPARTNDEEVDKLVELRRTLAIDACILTDTWLDDRRPEQLMEAGVPFAAFGRPWGAPDHGRWADVDGRAGAAEAAAHLRSQGHERIGYLGWSDGSPVGKDRRAGWAEALGLTPEAEHELAVEVEDTVDDGAAGMKELLARGATAVVCASDTLSLGAFTVLRRRGESGRWIIGFDNTPVARELGISSMVQPVEEVAATVLDMVLAQIADPGVDLTGVTIPPVLIARDGSGAIG